MFCHRYIRIFCCFLFTTGFQKSSGGFTQGIDEARFSEKKTAPQLQKHPVISILTGLFPKNLCDFFSILTN